MPLVEPLVTALLSHMYTHTQGAIIGSLKNSYKEFRRDKSKKRSKVFSPKSTSEKACPPGKTVSLSPPDIPAGTVYMYMKR